VTIRVNGLDTQWHAADIAAAAQAGPAAVVVPKVSSVADVAAIEAGLEAGGAPDYTKIWAMVETPVAMLHAEEIAAASERLTVLVMGTNDLAKELHAEHVPGRQPLLTGLGLCLLAARATGKVILDGVYNDIKDDAGASRPNAYRVANWASTARRSSTPARWSRPTGSGPPPPRRWTTPAP
jgi:citrate lyase subunit beta/citryl-CoA lyase